MLARCRKRVAGVPSGKSLAIVSTITERVKTAWRQEEEIYTRRLEEMVRQDRCGRDPCPSDVTPSRRSPGAQK